jgi:alpha-methylacyl-CoA racemase
MVLADLGCDVVRVEPPATNRNGKAWIDSICRHKSSIVIDFKLPASRQAFLDLLEAADILIDPYRPGAFDRMVGMGADELCRRYPKLIYARLTGFSRHDKRYARALGHENNFMAVSGALPALQHMHGENENEDEKGRKLMPKVTVNYVADFGGGSMACVVGILAAVIHRTASGKGQIVDASVQQGTSYLAIFPLQRRKGQPADEPSLPVNDVPWSDVYRTSDGKYMMVCSIEDIFYDRMIRGLGLDATSIPDRADSHNWRKLRDIFTNRFLSESQNHWRGIFDDLPACVSPVLDADDAGVDINQPLVHLSRTPSLPMELSEGPSQIPVLRPGQGSEEVVRRWLGARGKSIFTGDTASRILSQAKQVDRQPKSML